MSEPFDAALEAALKRLRSRERFESELLSFLATRGFDADTAGAVVAHLKAKGMLSDARALDSVLRRRAGKRAVGDERLKSELQALGVDAERGFGELPDERERAEAALSGRKSLTRLKAARFLAARGFSEETIRSVTSNLPESAQTRCE